MRVVPGTKVTPMNKVVIQRPLFGGFIGEIGNVKRLDDERKKREHEKQEKVK